MLVGWTLWTTRTEALFRKPISNHLMEGPPPALRRFIAVFGMTYGIVVASVLSTGPTAITILKYVVPVFAVMGIVAGAR